MLTRLHAKPRLVGGRRAVHPYYNLKLVYGLGQGTTQYTVIHMLVMEGYDRQSNGYNVPCKPPDAVRVLELRKHRLNNTDTQH